MIIPPSKRTSGVQEYYFSRKLKEIDAIDSERLASGLDKVVNLGIGAPDGFPPQAAVDALVQSAQQPGNHAYQKYIGIPELRRAFSQWYKRYYGVELSPEGQIQPLMGSKEGILLISLAFLDPGDKVLVPNPGYPTYTSASKLAGAQVVPYDLDRNNGWRPDFEAIEAAGLEGVKAMWVNYPHMPTGARADRALFQQIVDFGRKHNILIINDNPYSFILTDEPLSILSASGAFDCCLELNSLSKAHNMSGWRLGMLAGSQELVAQVLKVKSQMDSGIFRPLQLAAVEALSQGPEWFAALNAVYRRRRVLAGEIFRLLGAESDPSSAGLFLWGDVSRSPLLERLAPCAEMSIGERVSEFILHEAGVFITPGFIFGSRGEDYIRISLCATEEVLERCLKKIRAVVVNY